MDINTLIVAGLAGIAATLLSGKFLKRLILLPFKLIASKTKTKEDDKLVEEAAHDLGLDESAAKPLDSKEEPKNG
jgi:hypothetical protein